MASPSWSRLVRLYSERMYRLFGGKLWEIVRNPNIVNDPVFRRAAERAALTMVREVAQSNAHSWREAAMKAGQGRLIYESLQNELRRAHLKPHLAEIAEDNAALIQSVPQKVAERISAHAAKLVQQGKRPDEIERLLKRLAPELTKSHIHLIARTEVSKANTDLTRARAESIDIPVYQWITSEDSRVRQSHRNLDKVLVFWNDPPQPEELVGKHSSLGHYHAGSAPNCRCDALPVVSLDEISWPARVYRHGNITRMSRAAFVRLVPAYRKAA